MRNQSRWIAIVLVCVLVIIPFTHALTGLYSQTMTWNILANRSHAITYGGTCTDTAFYFNEIDANFDPDPDGNATKVAPSGISRYTGSTAIRDYNFAGISNPSSTFLEFLFVDTAKPPATYNATVEVEQPFYPGIASQDGFSMVTGGNSLYPGHKAVFKVIESAAKILALTFYFSGSSIYGTDCDTTGTGTDMDATFFLYDWNNLVYRNVGHHAGTGASISDDNSTFDKTIHIDQNIARFIGPDTNVTLLVQSVLGGTNPYSCMFADYIQLIVSYYPDNNSFCQSSSMAPMTLRNNGNTDINVDANFTTLFTGNDINLVLKVWQGTGSGCGTEGFGGWEKDCSNTTQFADLGSTQCRNYNQFNNATRARLIQQLVPGDTNQLCFSGDFNQGASTGNHPNYFGTTDSNSA